MNWLAIVIPGAVLVLLTIIFLPFYFAMIRPSMKRRRIEETGIPGVGLIQAVKDTGVTINRGILVKLTLLVQPSDGGAAFVAVATALVPRLNPGLHAPGGQVQVKYDPVTKAAAVLGG